MVFESLDGFMLVCGRLMFDKDFDGLLIGELVVLDVLFILLVEFVILYEIFFFWLFSYVFLFVFFDNGGFFCVLDCCFCIYDVDFLVNLLGNGVLSFVFWIEFEFV